MHDCDVLVDAWWEQGLQFGWGADVGDDGVVVSEEGWEEAGAEVSGCAEEEDFHVCEWRGVGWLFV